jgi:hypothetical protein
MIFKTVSSSGTTIFRSAQLHKESIMEVTAATSAQVNKFCFHRAIPLNSRTLYVSFICKLFLLYVCKYVYMYIHMY